MKTILALMLAGLPMIASADYVDVIEFRLNQSCPLETQLQVARDFNAQWGEKLGYRAEILAPLEPRSLSSFYWVGRTKNAETFGRAWDTWRSEIRDPNSVAGRLLSRYNACATGISRRGYEIYD
jgi:hypothetical protein